MDTIWRTNGNGQRYVSDLPKLILFTHHINDVAMAHIKADTELDFKKLHCGYEAQPTKSWQIVALIMTYNYKLRYYNNADYKNTLFLKSDHHIGFDLDDVCTDCLRRNNVHFPVGLEDGQFLAC